MKFFKDHQLPSVRTILARLLDAGTTDKSVYLRDPGDCKFGWELVSFQNELDFTALKTVAIRELEDSHLIPAMCKMLDEGETSVPAFENRLSEAVAATPKAAGMADDLWTHLHPLHVTADFKLQRPKTLTCFGTRFRIGRWRHLTKPVISSAVEALLVEERVANAHVQFGIEAQGRGPSDERSWDAIEPSFDALRGIVQLALSAGLVQYAESLPRGRIRFLPWAVGWSNKIMKPEFFTFQGMLEDDKQYPPEHLTQDEVAKILDVAKKVRRQTAPDSIGTIIADSLRLYAQALGAPLMAQCFLGLWQMAEAMTLAQDHGGDGDIVCSRLRVLPDARWGHKIECAKDILRRLFTLRNHIAHQGIYHLIGSAHINVLKTMCEDLLEWLMDHSGTIKDRAHLEQFFKVATMTDDIREVSLAGFGFYLDQLCGTRRQK